MIGVTGTQGKTTTTRLAEGGLERAGVRAGVIGTVGTRIAGEEVQTSLTTPEAPDLHALFAVMREREVTACVMEVSSHALVMGRVDGVVFDVGVFLNLGRDHLDFHADEEDYYRAKAALFTPERARLALVSVDDEHGRRLAGETPLPVRTMADGGRRRGLDGAADLSPGPDGRPSPSAAPAAEIDTAVPLPGGFNVGQRARRGRGVRRGGPGTPAGVAAGIAVRRGSPRAGSSASRQASRSRWSSTTPTSRMPSGAVAGEPATAHGRPAARLCRGPAATAIRASGRSWARSRAGLADVRGRDRRQPAHRGPRGDPGGRARGSTSGVPPRSSRRGTGAGPSARRCAWPGPATSWSSPGRATRPARRSPAEVHPFDDRAVVRGAAGEGIRTGLSGPKRLGNRSPGGPRRTAQRRTESGPSGPGAQGKGADESHPAERRVRAPHLPAGHAGGDQPVPETGFGQQIRDDGPTSHHTKLGTPTMGGVVIILATVLRLLPGQAGSR